MSKPPTLIAELIAEFLGTFVLILFGTGVVAMVVLFPANNPAATVHGGYTNITLGWRPRRHDGDLRRGKSFRRPLVPPSPSPSRSFVVFPGGNRSVFHRANRRSIPCRGRDLSKLSAGFHQSSPTGENCRCLHNLPCLPRVAASRISRSGHRHRSSALARAGDYRRVQRPARRQPRASDDRPGRRGDRYEFRRHARISHQSRS